MPISLVDELEEIRTLLWADTGEVGDLFRAGLIAFPGEPFDPPTPTQDPNNPAVWIDLDRGYSDAEMDTLGVEWHASTLDFAACVEQLRGCDARAAELCDDLKRAFTDQDTSTMMYFPERAYPAEEGIYQDVWWRRDWLLPVERREPLVELVLVLEARITGDGDFRVTGDGDRRVASV